MSFSDRYGFRPIREIQKETVDDSLFNRLWNVIYKREYPVYPIYDIDLFSNVEQLLDKLGQRYKYQEEVQDVIHNLSRLYKYLYENKDKWYLIYDLLEYYVYIHDKENEKEWLQKNINQILVEEKSAYRMTGYMFTPIIDACEFDALERGMKCKYDAPRQHITKAVMLYSDRKSPDYANAVKEAISAVESVCRIIVGDTGKAATLGQTIKKLNDKGLDIPPALEQAYSKLYGYTCDAGGIRHGSITMTNVGEEDARYMVVSCSAFVNYLIEKNGK